MKGTTAALVFGIIILAIIGAWVLTGGAGSPAGSATPPAATTAPPLTPAPATAVPSLPATPTTEATAAPSATITTAVPATTAATRPAVTTPVSAEQANAHFLAVAYSATNRLERYNYTATQNRLVISALTPTVEDLAAMEAVAKEFNGISRTIKVSENIKEGSNGNIIVKFLPETGLSQIVLSDIPDPGPDKESLTRREFSYQGKPTAKIVRGTIYINNNLAGDARTHAIARSIYYELGVTGDTADYPDSLFYAGENTNTALNTVDKKAVDILYEPGLANSMTLEDIKKVVYIS